MKKEGDEIHKVYNKNEKLLATNQSNLGHKLIGISLILSGISIFVIFTILIIITKTDYFLNQKFVYNSEYSKKIIEWFIQDKHYCLAFPIFIPVTFLILYFKWIAFNYFKHS